MTTTPAELIAELWRAHKTFNTIPHRQPEADLFGKAAAALEAAVRNLAFERMSRPPFGTWRGECGHLWERKDGDGVDCPICIALEAAQAGPIPMILHCPACHLQHIDAPEESLGRRFLDPGAKEWDNPPHRSHLCHGCGSIWRPADVPTEGVAAIQTKGSADGLVPQPQGSGDYVLVPREPGSCEGDDSGWILMFLNALHAHLPEDERPSSWMQFSDDQRERICNAYRAMISAATPADGG